MTDKLGDVTVSLDAIQVLRDEAQLDLVVAFRVKSKLGETVFRMPVQDADNLHVGVEAARKQLHQLAQKMAASLEQPIFDLSH